MFRTNLAKKDHNVFNRDYSWNVLTGPSPSCIYLLTCHSETCECLKEKTWKYIRYGCLWPLQSCQRLFQKWSSQKTIILVARMKDLYCFFQPQTTEYFFWALLLAQFVVLNGHTGSLLLWATLLYGTYQNLSHTQSASTLGLWPHSWNTEQAVWRLGLILWPSWRAVCLWTLCSRWFMTQEQRVPALTYFNDYRDLDQISGPIRFQPLRHFSLESWLHPPPAKTILRRI